MTPLSELIRVVRKKALLSQEDFAKALNVSVGTINRWENAKTKPNITAMKKSRHFVKKTTSPLMKSKRRGLPRRSKCNGRCKERSGAGRAIPPYL